MNTTDLLIEMGFTDYEIKVYLALAQLGTASAQKIASTSGVPVNKVYHSLIHLIEKGFIASLGIRPQQYKVASIQKFYTALEEKQEKLRNMHKEVLSLQKLIEQKGLQDTALVLKGKDKILDMLTQATENVQHFAYSFVGNLNFDYQTAKPVAAAIKRGVEVRFIAHKHPLHKDVYKRWKQLGVKIRYSPKEEQKSVRFSTFDGKVCRLTIGEPEIPKQEDYLTFWIESPAFASLLKDQFDVMWKKCSD